MNKPLLIGSVLHLIATSSCLSVRDGRGEVVLDKQVPQETSYEPDVPGEPFNPSEFHEAKAAGELLSSPLKLRTKFSEISLDCLYL